MRSKSRWKKIDRKEKCVFLINNLHGKTYCPQKIRKREKRIRVRCKDKQKLKNSVNGWIFNFRGYEPGPLKVNNIFNGNKIVRKQSYCLKAIVLFESNRIVCLPVLFLIKVNIEFNWPYNKLNYCGPNENNSKYIAII